MSRVTMRDIAQQARVSVETVSRALNGKPDISTKTRETIEAIARESGYVHRKRARLLSRPGNGTVGMVVADNANPFFSTVLRGAEDVLSEAGYHMIVANTGENYDKEKRIIEMFVQRELDGMLITPTQSSMEDIQSLTETRVPFVLVGRHFRGLAANAVVTDELKGAYSAIQHLLRLGHRKILFLDAPSHISSATERLAGLQKAFEEAGDTHDTDLFRICQPTMESAYNATQGVLVERLDFTAVFTFCDLMMLGVVKALREAGRSIPEDVSLVGFDDIDFVSLLTPPLTSVRVQRYELGAQGAKLLLRLLRAEQGGGEIVLPTELIVRQSTQRVGD